MFYVTRIWFTVLIAINLDAIEVIFWGWKILPFTALSFSAFTHERAVSREQHKFWLSVSHTSVSLIRKLVTNGRH
jgi:hypothetical protein